MNFGKDIVNIDLECTGSNFLYYSICEVGAVLIDAVTLNVKSEFSSIVYPYIDNFDPEAMAVHGIPKEDLYKAPKLENVLDSFQLWVIKEASVDSERKICLSAWGAYFDLPFLRYAYTYLGRQYPFDLKYIDIKAIARWEFGLRDQPFSKGGLERCSKRLGLEFEGVHHRALDDARQGAVILKGLMQLRYKEK